MSHYRLLLVAFVLIVPVIALACAPAAKADVPVTVTYDEFSKQKAVVRDLDVQAGSNIIVTLFSNKTTGFSWDEKAQLSDAKVLAQTAHNFIAPQNTDGRVGAGGNEVWTFKALAPGKCTVYIEYNQPWAGGAKATWTFKLNVNVK